MESNTYSDLSFALLALALGAIASGIAFFQRKRIFEKIGFEGSMFTILTVFWTAGTFFVFIIFGVYFLITTLLLTLKFLGH